MNLTHVYIKTLGCKVNAFDSEAMAHQLSSRGYRIVTHLADADVAVVNSCSVTAAAEKETRYLTRLWKRLHPQMVTVVTGCYAQIQSAFLSQLASVDLIIPNEVKGTFSELLGEYLVSARQTKLPPNVLAVADNRQGQFKTAHTLFDRPQASGTRAFLKIQDGCNGFCSYCQIPFARGQSTSVPSSAVVAQAGQLVASGVREIVLTGIHLGDYGEDLAHESVSLAQIITTIFATTSLERLRISSLEPSEVRPELVAVLAAHRDRFCPHFHLPLQSGSDSVLRRMRRTYTRAAYLESLSQLRSFFPDAQYSADIIPGFPGESEADHEQTLDFVEHVAKLHCLHVFPYSLRPNTAAARLPDHLPPDVVRRRAAQLRQLSAQLHKDFCKKWLGRTVSVLWEGENAKRGRLGGKTPHYLRVVAPQAAAITPGTLSDAKIIGFFDANQLLAQPVPTGASGNVTSATSASSAQL